MPSGVRRVVDVGEQTRLAGNGERIEFRQGGVEREFGAAEAWLEHIEGGAAVEADAGLGVVAGGQDRASGGVLRRGGENAAHERGIDVGKIARENKDIEASGAECGDDPSEGSRAGVQVGQYSIGEGGERGVGIADKKDAVAEDLAERPDGMVYEHAAPPGLEEFVAPEAAAPAADEDNGGDGVAGGSGHRRGRATEWVRGCHGREHCREESRWRAG